MIKLDVCCGQYKHEGFVGMDKRAVEGVDIVHDVQEFPWPIDDGTCTTLIITNAWSCIEPKYRIQLMDEIWRVLAHDGLLQIVDQYYGGDRAHHDPTYYSCPNEWTFYYFDPTSIKYKVYEPKPWKILRYEYKEHGQLRVALTPVKEVVR